MDQIATLDGHPGSLRTLDAAPGQQRADPESLDEWGWGASWGHCLCVASHGSRHAAEIPG